MIRDNKHIAIITILVLALVCTSGFMIYLIDTVNYLQNTIKQKDVIINKGLVSNKAKVESLTDTVKSFTEKYDFIISGKKLNSTQFVDLFSKVESEMEDYKYKYELAQKIYGFEIVKTIQGTKALYSAKDYTKADSAQLTLKWFRNRIKLKDGVWHIDNTGKEDLEKYDKAVAAKLRSMLDTTSKKQ